MKVKLCTILITSLLIGCLSEDEKIDVKSPNKKIQQTEYNKQKPASEKTDPSKRVANNPNVPKKESSLQSVEVQKIAPVTLPKEGLLCYYPFDGNAEDKSGRENHGVVNGATASEDRFGNSNMAFAFGGDDKNFIQANVPQGLSESPFTVTFWHKAANYFGRLVGPQGHGKNWLIAFGKVPEGKSDPTAFHIGLYGEADILVIGFWGEALEVEHVAPTNEWEHIAVAWDGDRVQSVYANAKKIGDYNLEGARPVIHEQGELLIGKQLKYDEYYKGSIDEVCIYNRVLSEKEIRATYESK